MTIRINDLAPDFNAETTTGPIRFHEWLNNQWAIFFSHPKDFTPICTTEIGLMARIEKDFEKRSTKIIGHSVDRMSEHMRWLEDIRRIHGMKPTFPIIADEELTIAKLYDMLPAEAVPGIRTPADNATVRSVFIIGPDQRIKLSSSYPMTVGRNFDEVLRTLDALQLNAKYKLATPVNWKPGDELVIPPAISDTEAATLFPLGWNPVAPYLRMVDPKTLEGKREVGA